METAAIIEGLTILERYRADPDGHNTEADHAMIHAFRTDRPVEGTDLDRLVKLGWFQEAGYCDDDVETDEKFAAQHYDPNESWTCYT